MELVLLVLAGVILVPLLLYGLVRYGEWLVICLIYTLRFAPALALVYVAIVEQRSFFLLFLFPYTYYIVAALEKGDITPRPREERAADTLKRASFWRTARKMGGLFSACLALILVAYNHERLFSYLISLRVPVAIFGGVTVLAVGICLFRDRNARRYYSRVSTATLHE